MLEATTESWAARLERLLAQRRSPDVMLQVGLTLIDVRRLLDEAQGEELRLELPAKASHTELAVA